MVRKTKQDRYREKFEREVDDVFENKMMSLLKKVEIFASMVRSYESTKSRLEGYVKILKDKIIRLLKSLGMDEYRFNRTQVELIFKTVIEPDEKGEKIYQKIEDFLRKELGPRKAKKILSDLITIQKKRIPARDSVNYEIEPDSWDQLDDKLQKELPWIINGGKPKVKIGNIPKRAKEGKLRRKKR